MTAQIMTNRAPVLTLWASVVAEALGFGREAALSLGKAVAGLNAQAKGRSLGIYGPPRLEKGKPPKNVGLGEEFWVELCGRRIPARNTADGIRAVVKDKPVASAPVETYLEGKFGEHLVAVRSAMESLARSMAPETLSERAYHLYEAFRPVIPAGVRGWGAKGKLDLDLIKSLASEKRRP